MRPPPPRPARAVPLVALASAGTVLSLFAAAFLLSRPGGSLPPLAGARALENEEVRAAVIERLVAGTNHIYDSHPDAEVGRVLLPDLDAPGYHGHGLRTNARGMREVDYELPKPAGVRRVVLLGDSFVFGHGVAAVERMGVYLRAYLEDRATALDGPLECLHLGVSSWNATSAAAFARRRLAELQPDLLVQLVVPNDLDDSVGVRGFGAMASFVPRAPGRADARVYVHHPGRFEIGTSTNQLLLGLDWESQRRYRELARSAGRLARAVEAGGGRYLLAVHWAHHKPVLRPYLEAELRADQILYLPSTYRARRELWVGPGDPHWNRAGHEAFAKLLFGVLRSRRLLADLGLSPWPDVEDQAAREVAAGLREAALPTRGRPAIASSLDFVAAPGEALRQVHGGVDDRGRASPYASLLLRVDGPAVRVAGRALGRYELEGLSVRVYADEHPLGRLELAATGAFEHAFSLPDPVAGRNFVTIRFEADDWIHAAPEYRRCQSFVLERLATLRP